MGSGARTPDPPEVLIAAALSAEHVDLWNTSGLFRSSVESLAGLLVPMVQGLADEAVAAAGPDGRPKGPSRPVTLLGRLATSRREPDGALPALRDDDGP